MQRSISTTVDRPVGAIPVTIQIIFVGANLVFALQRAITRIAPTPNDMMNVKQPHESRAPRSYPRGPIVSVPTCPRYKKQSPRDVEAQGVLSISYISSRSDASRSPTLSISSCEICPKLFLISALWIVTIFPGFTTEGKRSLASFHEARGESISALLLLVVIAATITSCEVVL